MKTLYPFQVKGLERMHDCNKVAFYWDMGLGKSLVGITKARMMEAKRVLIVCQKSKLDDWYDVVKDESHYMPMDLRSRTDLLLFVNPNYDDYIGCVGIINYDLVWRRTELEALNRIPFTLILDESSEIQNEKAKRTKFILNSLKPANVILLSGTPVGGKYENLWSQLRLLGLPMTAWQFRQKFVNYRDLYLGNRIVKIVDPKHPYKRVGELKRLMGSLNCDFLKTEDVLELPEQRDILVECDTPMPFYTFMKTDMVTIKDWKTGEYVEMDTENVLTKRLRASQICSIYNEDRFQRFEDLLKSTNDRLVVFYRFQEEYERLQSIAQSLKKPVSAINGSTKDLDAYESEGDSVTLVQYQAGAMGLNLQKASKCIFFSLTDSSNLYEQARKRIHRIGQRNTCTYWIFKCRDGIDDGVYKALMRKADYTNDLFIKDSQTWAKRVSRTR